MSILLYLAVRSSYSIYLNVNIICLFYSKWQTSLGWQTSLPDKYLLLPGTNYHHAEFKYCSATQVCQLLYKTIKDTTDIQTNERKTYYSKAQFYKEG